MWLEYPGVNVISVGGRQENKLYTRFGRVVQKCCMLLNVWT